MLVHNKDDIEFVTKFPCFLGHPVSGFDKVVIKENYNSVLSLKTFK